MNASCFSVFLELLHQFSLIDGQQSNSSMFPLDLENNVAGKELGLSRRIASEVFMFYPGKFYKFVNKIKNAISLKRLKVET